MGIGLKHHSQPLTQIEGVESRETTNTEELSW